VGFLEFHIQGKKPGKAYLMHGEEKQKGVIHEEFKTLLECSALGTDCTLLYCLLFVLNGRVMKLHTAGCSTVYSFFLTVLQYSFVLYYWHFVFRHSVFEHKTKTNRCHIDTKQTTSKHHHELNDLLPYVVN
jgi:hypothetical protein